MSQHNRSYATKRPVKAKSGAVVVIHTPTSVVSLIFNRKGRLANVTQAEHATEHRAGKE